MKEETKIWMLPFSFWFMLCGGFGMLIAGMGVIMSMDMFFFNLACMCFLLVTFGMCIKCAEYP